MCGIVGYCSTDRRLAPETLRRMRDTLIHRGPDDAGLMLWDEQGRVMNEDKPAFVGLGHRRLSIIDLSEAGRQPLGNEDGRHTIVYNGEFYNFEDFVPSLTATGHRFTSRTDTEVIVHLLEEVGIEQTLARMNGMFAFAIWDRAASTMTLARDRLGKKPLFYVLQPDGTLLFASEIKALLASGAVDRQKLDEDALAQCWQFGYAMGEKTIYKDVRRLLPGHFAVWKNGRLNVRAYWDCPFGVGPLNAGGLDDLTDECEALLADAIRIRLKADVPVGLFLSGGIDSGVIAALTSRVVGKSLTAYTIRFERQSHDESPWAASVAKHLGMEHCIMSLTEDLHGQFAGIARQFDEPFGDSSSIPTYFVCKLARQNVTVALTGDGGDELFGGYDTYAAGLGWWGNAEQKRLFRVPRRGMDWLGDLHQRWRRGDDRFNSWACSMPPSKRARVFSEAVRARGGHKGIYGDRERWYPSVRTADLLSQMQYLDLKTYLPDDILVKVDRMSMANSLECRSPLLDYRLVEYASRLPYEAKMDGAGTRKVVLRNLLSRFVPRQLTERSKSGFAIPWTTMWDRAANDGLRNRWRQVGGAWLDPAAGDWIFKDGTSDFVHWTAFSTILFMEANQ